MLRIDPLETHNYMSKKRSTVFASAMSRSAERRQCPECGRKSALKRDEWGVYCRWCGYSKEFGEPYPEKLQRALDGGEDRP